MKRALALLSLMALAIVCLTCKKDPEVNKVRVDVIEGEKVFNMVDGAVTVRFQGTCSLSNSSVTVRKMTLALGQDASLADANVHQATLNDTVFSVKVDGLSANATYYYRYQVDYGASTEYKTEIKHFETPSVSVPSVTTAEVTEYTATTAQCGGKVTSTGGSEVTERGVCWSTDHNPDIDGDHKASESEGESFRVEVTGLSAETTYYVRAYAKNDAGVGYGEEVSFTTAQVQGFLVSVSANPAAGGTVSGGGEYASGAECTVTATANEGYMFEKWTEDGNQASEEARYTFTVTGNRTLVAQFQANSYTVSASADPHEGGTVSGGGEFHYGDECTLTATAAQGYRFVNWTRGDIVVYGDPVYAFPVTESASYVAHFQVAAFDLDVTADPKVIPQGGSSQLEAAASGGNGSFTYSWSPSSSLNNAAIHNPTASPMTTTTYTCTVTSGGQTGNGSCTVTVVCPPANLAATVQNNSDIVLTWSASAPAPSYKVYKGNTLIASNVTGTTYTDSNLSPGTYTYQVSAVYQYVESPKSDEVSASIYDALSVTATANPPTIPFGSSSTLTATPTGGDGNYTYNWSPSTSLNNAHIQSPTTTTGSTRTYTVTVTSNGETATASVTVNVVKAPTNLTATIQSNNVYLHWNAAEPADSYNVYRNSTLIDQGITSNIYNDNDLDLGTYTYQVSTVFQGIESPKSNMAYVDMNWLYYGNEVRDSFWGLNSGGTLGWGVMFPPDLLAQYNGTTITKVRVYTGHTGDYTVKLYSGGTSSPSTLMATQVFTVTASNERWSEFVLNEPLAMPADQSLWASIQFTHVAGDHVAAASEGINEPNSRWQITESGNWIDFMNNNGGVDVCFMIEVYITEGRGVKGLERKLSKFSVEQDNNEHLKASCLKK